MATHQIDQDQLVAQIKSRKTEAMGYLFDHYSGAINGVISRIIENESVAEEVLQDAFLKFWDRIDHYDPSKGRFFTWMVNISRNLAIDKLRSKEIKKASKTEDLADYVSDSRAGQQMQYTDAIGIKDVLGKLREEERFIVEMIYFKGYTQSELAEEHNIPLGTVKTRLRMGLKNLRKILAVG